MLPLRHKEKSERSKTQHFSSRSPFSYSLPPFSPRAALRKKKEISHRKKEKKKKRRQAASRSLYFYLSITPQAPLSRPPPKTKREHTQAILQCRASP